MEEAEITYWYPEAWNEEFRRTGVVKCWLDDSPHLFDGTRGTLTVSADNTLANFSTYALMYLLWRNDGIESLTYFSVQHRNQETGVEKHSTNKYTSGWGMSHLGGSALRCVKPISLNRGSRGNPICSAGIRRTANGSLSKQKGRIGLPIAKDAGLLFAEQRFLASLSR